MTEKIKSVLQRTLETQGWEFLTNVATEYDCKYDEKLGYMSFRRVVPKSDYEIRTEFLSRPSFQDVKIAADYDVDANPINKMRAVYVIRSSTA